MNLAWINIKNNKKKLTDPFGSVVLVTYNSKPANFHAPFIFIIIDSGHMFLCNNLTSLCKKAKPSASYKQINFNYLKFINNLSKIIPALIHISFRHLKA